MQRDILDENSFYISVFLLLNVGNNFTVFIRTQIYILYLSSLLKGPVTFALLIQIIPYTLLRSVYSLFSQLFLHNNNINKC